MSLRNGSTCSSPEAHVVLRRNSNERPSGETDGFVSASAGGCGFVSSLLSPVSSAVVNKASGFPSPPESVTLTHVLSGHHAR